MGRRRLWAGPIPSSDGWRSQALGPTFRGCEPRPGRAPRAARSDGICPPCQAFQHGRGFSPSPTLPFTKCACPGRGHASGGSAGSQFPPCASGGSDLGTQRAQGRGGGTPTDRNTHTPPTRICRPFLPRLRCPVRSRRPASLQGWGWVHRVGRDALQLLCAGRGAAGAACTARSQALSPQAVRPSLQPCSRSSSKPSLSDSKTTASSNLDVSLEPGSPGCDALSCGTV